MLFPGLADEFQRQCFGDGVVGIEHPGQVAGDGHRSGLGRRIESRDFSEPGGIVESFENRVGGDDDSLAGPVRVGLAVEWSTLVVSCLEECGHQVDDFDALSGEQSVEILLVDVQSWQRVGPVVVLRRRLEVPIELFGVDGKLGGDGYDEQSDADLLELFVEIDDGFERVGVEGIAGSRDFSGVFVPERSDGECSQFGHEEDPAVRAFECSEFALFGRGDPQADELVRGGDVFRRLGRFSCRRRGDQESGDKVEYGRASGCSEPVHCGSAQ